MTKYVEVRKAHFKVLLGQYSAMVGFKAVLTLSPSALGGVLVMNEQMNLGQFVAAEIRHLLLINAVEEHDFQHCQCVRRCNRAGRSDRSPIST